MDRTTAPALQPDTFKSPRMLQSWAGNEGEGCCGLKLGGSRTGIVAGPKAWQWWRNSTVNMLLRFQAAIMGQMLLPPWPQTWGKAGMAAGTWPMDLTGPCAGGRCEMRTQPLRPSSHLPSGAGLGPASAENKISSCWQEACPPCAAISSDHLRENGWVPRPGRDNKGQVPVTQAVPDSSPSPAVPGPCCSSTPSPQPGHHSAPLHRDPMTTFLRFSACKPSQLHPLSAVTGAARCHRLPPTPEVPGFMQPLSALLYSPDCGFDVWFWWMKWEQIAFNYTAKFCFPRFSPCVVPTANPQSLEGLGCYN